jgi:hypothetical protein
MILTEVTNSTTDKNFINVPREIYKDDPVWICPLDVDIRAVFDPKKNSFHQHGTCTRWVLQSNDGKLIGRIAAFINDLKAYKTALPNGGVGFFECINNYQAAQLLFDTAKEWLEKQGMKEMIGPINFGENDNYWGLLTEGFTTPSYGMNYNPPYYKDFIDKYGFKCPTGVKGRNSDNRLYKEKIGWEVSQPLIDGLKNTYDWMITLY